MKLTKKPINREQALNSYLLSEIKTAELQNKGLRMAPMYHGTSPKNLKSIIAKGLLLSKTRESVLYTSNPVVAKDYAISNKGDLLVVKVNPPKFKKLLDHGKVRNVLISPDCISHEDLPVEKLFIVKKTSSGKTGYSHPLKVDNGKDRGRYERRKRHDGVQEPQSPGRGG